MSCASEAVPPTLLLFGLARLPHHRLPLCLSLGQPQRAVHAPCRSVSLLSGADHRELLRGHTAAGSKFLCSWLPWCTKCGRTLTGAAAAPSGGTGVRCACRFADAPVIVTRGWCVVSASVRAETDPLLTPAGHYHAGRLGRSPAPRCTEGTHHRPVRGRPDRPRGPHAPCDGGLRADRETRQAGPHIRNRALRASDVRQWREAAGAAYLSLIRLW